MSERPRYKVVIKELPPLFIKHKMLRREIPKERKVTNWAIFIEWDNGDKEELLDIPHELTSAIEKYLETLEYED